MTSRAILTSRREWKRPTRAASVGLGDWTPYSPTWKAGGSPVTPGAGGSVAGEFRIETMPDGTLTVDLHFEAHTGGDGRDTGSGVFTVTLPALPGGALPLAAVGGLFMDMNGYSGGIIAGGLVFLADAATEARLVSTFYDVDVAAGTPNDWNEEDNSFWASVRYHAVVP